MIFARFLIMTVDVPLTGLVDVFVFVCWGGEFDLKYEELPLECRFP